MSKQIDFGSDEFFIQKYKELKSSRKMGEFYHCDKSSVLNHAKKIGYDVNSNKQYKLTKKEKEEIIQKYNIKTSSELAKEYNVSRGMITKIWYDANLKGKQRLPYKAKDQKDLTNQKFNKLTALYKTEDRDASGNVIWMCQCECGNIKKVSAYNLYNGIIKSCGCLKNFQNSNNSLGNLKIIQLLTNAHIPFEREKIFKSCIDKTYLPFDFFVNNTYCIQFDGKQHFKETKSLFYDESIEKHDLIKNNWCKQNNIPLIRIPFTHLKKLCIEDLLLESSSFII